MQTLTLTIGHNVGAAPVWDFEQVTTAAADILALEGMTAWPTLGIWQGAREESTRVEVYAEPDEVSRINAAHEWLKDCHAAELDAWKARHGYKRLTAARRAEWEQVRPHCWFVAEGQTAYAYAALFLAAVQPQQSATAERRHAAELDTLEHLREVRELSDGRLLFEGTRREDGTRRAFVFAPTSHAVEVL